MRERLTVSAAAVIAIGALLACGGGGPPSKVKGAPSAAPDESYQLGAVGHQEGFIWTCTGGQRVHMSRGCGEYIGCGKWSVERGPCGAPLAGEPPASERKAMQYGKWE